MYYIYAYLDPRTNLPFYIGKGSKYRMNDHMRETESHTENRNKLKILLELKSLNLSPVIEKLETDIQDEITAYHREDYYILLYGRKGIEPYGILTNKTVGGRKPPTPNWDEERKAKHRAWNAAYWTEERKKNHNRTGSIHTVSVTNLEGISRRILKTEYDAIDKSGPIDTWEYVSVSSKESKRRKSLKKSP